MLVKYFLMIFLLFLSFSLKDSYVALAQSEPSIFGKILQESQSSPSVTLSNSDRTTNINPTVYQTSNSLASKVGKGGWLLITFIIAFGWLIYIFSSRKQ